MPDGLPQTAGPSGIPDSDEKPPWALAVADLAPTGDDRQGRGRSFASGPPPRKDPVLITTTGPQPPKRHPSH
jgi:hypothetical protein